MWSIIAGEVHSHLFNHSIPASASVYSIQPIVRHAKTGTGGGALASFYYENGAVDITEANALCTSTTITNTLLPIRTTLPTTGGALTPANLKTMDAGFINSGGRGCQIYALNYNVVAKFVDAAPVVTASCSATGTQGSAYSCAPSATDVDAGQTQTWSLATSNTCGFVSINSSTGVVSGTPNDDQVGACTLAIRSYDGYKYSNTYSRTVTISNLAPTLSIANQNFVPYASAAVVIRTDAEVQSNEEGFGTYSFDHATTSATRCTDNGVLSINSTNGQVTFDPNNTYQGTCNVKVVFNDGNASNNTVSSQFAVTVYAPNNTPVISAACATSLNHGSAYGCVPGITDDGPAQFWAFTSNTCSWASINSSTGVISGLPNDDQVGACSYTFRVFDNLQYSNSITVNVTVNNIAPTLTIANAPAIGYGSAATVIRNNTAVQSSEEGYGTYSLDNATATAPRCSDNGTVSIDSYYGIVTFDPNNTYQGTCNIKVVFNDGNASNNTVAASFTATVNPPIAGGTPISGFTNFCPNTTVMDIEPLGANRALFAGSFTSIGKCSGSGIPVSISTGEPVAALASIAKVEGSIRTAVPDGAGGWYIGGSFSKVGGQTRSQLARINADGSLHPFNKGVETGGGPYAMKFDNGRLYIVGHFAYASTLPASNQMDCQNFAVYDVATDTISCPIGFDQTPYAIETDANNIYIGGTNQDVGPISKMALVDKTNGARFPFTPYVSGVVIESIAADGTGGWYVGGRYYYTGGYLKHFFSDGTPDTSFNPTISYGRVYQITVSGTTTYLGTDIGALAIDSSTGAAIPGFNADVSGVVYEIFKYGSTLYLGGNFSTVGGQTRAKIASVDAPTGAVTSWNPIITGGAVTDVKTIKENGGSIYFSGSFTSVNATSRSNIAAVHPTTGVLTSFNPPTIAYSGTPEVNDFEFYGGNIYFGGTFSTVGGTTRWKLAAVSLTTNTLQAWDPRSMNGVDDMELDGTTLYFVGNMGSVGNPWVSRGSSAAVDIVTGALTNWQPNSNGINNAIAIQGGVIAIGGSMTIGGAKSRPFLASVNKFTYEANDWIPTPNNYIYSMAMAGNKLLIGGSFTQVGGASHVRVAAIDTTSGVPSFSVSTNNTVYAITVDGSNAYLGGEFTTVGGQSRSMLARIDATTGAVDSWSPPTFNNTGVRAISTYNNYVYVGGVFTDVGGSSKMGFVTLDSNTAAMTGWEFNLAGSVLTLPNANGVLYLGGGFTGINAVRRSYLAAVDTTTDELTDWAPVADNGVEDLEVSGTTVYVAGSFTTINGQARSKVAAIDTVTAAPTAWTTTLTGSPYAVKVSGTTLYIGGNFTYAGGQTRNHLAGLSTSTGLATTFNPNPSSYVYQLAIDGTTMYVGGGFATIGGQARTYAAAVDMTSGLATAWDPQANNNVYAVTVTASTVYLGGNISTLKGVNRFWIGAVDKSANLTSWNPSYDGTIRDILIDGSVIYSGGRAYNDTTGAILTWNTGFAGMVESHKLMNGKIYMGGTFQERFKILPKY
jgi:hypothetical protein